MAFNSDTYYANKSRKNAYAELDRARDIKARAARGEAYDWELPRIAILVSYARSEMRSCLHYRFLANLKRNRKAI